MQTRQVLMTIPALATVFTLAHLSANAAEPTKHRARQSKKISPQPKKETEVIKTSQLTPQETSGRPSLLSR